MPPTAAFNEHTIATIADHGARITSLEDGQKRIEGKIDKILYLALASLAGIAGELITHLAGK